MKTPELSVQALFCAKGSRENPRIFSHPDWGPLPARHCRYRNRTGSTPKALADCTAGRGSHPALKTNSIKLYRYYTPAAPEIQYPAAKKLSFPAEEYFLSGSPV